MPNGYPKPTLHPVFLSIPVTTQLSRYWKTYLLGTSFELNIIIVFWGHLHHHCNWRPYFRLDTRGSQAPVFYRSFFPLRLRTCIKKNCLQVGLVSDRSVQIQVQTLWNKFTTLWHVMYFCPAQCTQLHFRWFGSVAISLHCQYDRHTKVWFTRISV